MMMTVELIVQAMAEEIPMLTFDAKFGMYEVEVLDARA